MELQERYIESLTAEIASYKCDDKKIKIDTVFIGGGTPSLLPPHFLKRISDCIKDNFDIMPTAEITIEVNPGTLSLEKVLAYKECGINRVSIGLQSIHENELKTLGRIHAFDEFLDAFTLIRENLTDNINIDLMYGIPHQTIESFKETLRTVAALSPAHISAYGLIIEEGTPFFDNRYTLPIPSEDDECDMYAFADKYLSEQGYLHYEISNYAKPGKQSRHNLKYWHDEEYIGVGLSAHSYHMGKRYSNSDDFSEYFSACCAKYNRGDEVNIAKDPCEYVMLALRLSEGFSLSEYKRIFGEDFSKGKEDLLKVYENQGFLKKEGGRIFLTPKGFYVSNTIISGLIDFTT